MSELTDITRHPRFQFGRHGNTKFIMHDLHSTSPQEVTEGIYLDWEPAYNRADELNRQHYGNESFTGWQRNMGE